MAQLPSISAGHDAQTLSQLRTSLIQALRRSPESRGPLCDALELLENLQQRAGGTAASAAAGPMRRPPKVQQYTIGHGADGPFLAEHRQGQPQPFRCPLAVYMTAADELAASSEPLHFDQLMERVNRRLGQRQPDYRLRVALRFWLAQHLAQRGRTRYWPVDRQGFVRQARQVWDQLWGRSRLSA